MSYQPYGHLATPRKKNSRAESKKKKQVRELPYFQRTHFFCLVVLFSYVGGVEGWPWIFVTFDCFNTYFSYVFVTIGATAEVRLIYIYIYIYIILQRLLVSGKRKKKKMIFVR